MRERSTMGFTRMVWIGRDGQIRKLSAGPDFRGLEQNVTGITVMKKS
jgi:hypothetical protein